jgi:hypothetical protein
MGIDSKAKKMGPKKVNRHRKAQVDVSVWYDQNLFLVDVDCCGQIEETVNPSCWITVLKLNEVGIVRSRLRHMFKSFDILMQSSDINWASGGAQKYRSKLMYRSFPLIRI